MSVDRYPLHWPTGWKRTSWRDRERAPFTKSETRTSSDGQPTRTVARPVTITEAAERLERQIASLGGASPILSTNVRLRMDGRPNARDGEPSDPGAAVYFELNKQDRCLACDKWNRVADNIAALAAHIDALRRIDRYGVGTLDQAFTGYVGLPAMGSTWRTTLGFGPDQTVTAEMIKAARRDRARDSHPDVVGGSHDAMASLNAAVDEGLAELGQTS